MSSVKILVFLVVWMVLLSGLSQAKRLESRYFRQLFFQEIAQGLPWPQEDLRLERFMAEPGSIEVPEGAKEVIKIRQGPQVGSNLLLVDYYFQGRLLQRVRLMGYIEALLPVLIAKRPLSRHHLLSEDDFTIERRPLTRLPKDVITKPEEALGLRTRMSLRAGQVLRRSSLEIPPVIKRGKLVRILAEGPGFTVSAVGEARQDGRPGEIIRVRNLSSKREVLARVVDAETVRVTY